MEHITFYHVTWTDDIWQGQYMRAFKNKKAKKRQNQMDFI